MSVSLEKATEQEVVRLKAEMPTLQDIPTCTNHLDTYFNCLSMKYQAKALYRYGERRSCSDKLDNFKFCMSSKGMHPEEKRDVWIRRRAEWWANRRLTKSSEDVWEAREVRLQDTFSEPID